MPPDDRAAGVQTPYRAFDIVAIAASAGGLASVARICAALPPDFPAPIVLAQHLRRQRPSQLVEVLGRRTALAVRWAQEGAALRAGAIVVAPPDTHLLINADGTQALSRALPLHFARPAADLLFASVASRFHARAVGVVLSGTGRDGALGAAMIKHMGGRVLAEDVSSAQYFAMPSATIATGCVDFVLPLAYIAPALLALVMAPVAAELFRVGIAFSHAHVGRLVRGHG
jgi:two-component system chemotaxis response regulator CheB